MSPERWRTAGRWTLTLVGAVAGILLSVWAATKPERTPFEAAFLAALLAVLIGYLLGYYYRDTR